MAKEPKQEALKREKDGLDVWDDIFRYAETGHEAIEDGDYERLKWYGIYQQRPKGSGYFMLRVKVPAGQMTPLKLRAIGQMAQKYARNVADVTTRQDIQLHWIQVRDLPDILDTIYNKLGMYQHYACGDTPRNVTGCPLAGIDADEIVDCGKIAPAVSDMFRALGKEVSNLPRKFKCAIAGCAIHCHAPQINCLGLYGATRRKNGQVEKGLGLMLGGGLRNTPHMAQSLRVFLPPDIELIKDVSRKVAGMFRDADELRQGRLKARFKFRVAARGWEAMRDELEAALGYMLEHDDTIVDPIGAGHHDHVGIGRQKDGLSYIGIPIERGRISGDQLVALADLADRYVPDNRGEIRATIKQNLILVNVPPDRVDDLSGELAAIGLDPKQHALRSSLISCTGIEFCSLAVVETKQRAKEVLNYLEQVVGLDEELFIAISGCPNSCAQYQTADIGLSGVPTQYKGEKVEGYHVDVGGRLGVDPVFGREVSTADGKRLKLPSPIVHEAIERLIKAYLAEGRGEGFANWSRCQDITRIADLLCPPGTLDD